MKYYKGDLGHKGKGAPGRCPVSWRISSVTTCRSKRVRPQEGQLTYSVFVLRILEPWRPTHTRVQGLEERRRNIGVEAIHTHQGPGLGGNGGDIGDVAGKG